MQSSQQSSSSSFSLPVPVRAFLTDVFFGVYAVAVIRRIMFPDVLHIDVPVMSNTELIMIVLVGFVLSVLMFGLRTSIGSLIFDRVSIADTLRYNVSQHIVWIISIITIITGWIVTKISVVDFFSSQGLQAAGRIFSAMFQPEWSIFSQAFFAIIETVYLALMATLFALPVSFVLSFFAAQNLTRHHAVARSLYVAVRFIANLSRSIEPLIWAIIFSVWVGIGPFAGMLALIVHTIASLTKQYSEQIEDIDDGPMEAIEATGANHLQVIWFAVVPQILMPFLSFTIYRWDINVRMATIIGLVGGGGIGTLLMQYQGLAKWNEVGLIVMMIAFVVWVMDYMSARIRQAIR